MTVPGNLMYGAREMGPKRGEFFEATHGPLIFRGMGPANDLGERIVKHLDDRRHLGHGNISLPFPIAETINIKPVKNPLYQSRMLVLWEVVAHEQPKVLPVADEVLHIDPNQGNLFEEVAA